MGYAADAQAGLRFLDLVHPDSRDRYLDVVAELPRTESGKVQKFKLRERGVGPGTWDREAGNEPGRRLPDSRP